MSGNPGRKLLRPIRGNSVLNFFIPLSKILLPIVFVLNSTAPTNGNWAEEFGAKEFWRREVRSTTADGGCGTQVARDRPCVARACPIASGASRTPP